MSNDDLKSGDLVRLKSGGRIMTVQQAGGPFVYCVWFAKDDAVLRAGAFAVTMLEKAETSKGDQPD